MVSGMKSAHSKNSLAETIDKPQDHTVLAVIFAAVNAFMLTAMNMFAKLLGDYFPPEQITFFRSISAFLMLMVGLVLLRKLSLVKTQRPVAHIVRSVIGTVGLFFGIWTYTLMPMANATTLIFTQPLWVVILSYPLLKEKVGIYRSLAVLVGFSGILVIAGPGGDFTAFGLMIGLIAGLFNALVAICLRWLGQTESAATTVFYFLLYGSLIMGGFLPFTGQALPADNHILALFLILGLGGFGLASLLTKTYSYRLGSAALVTPISYTMILWAGLFDYFLWDRTPSWNIALGAAIIIGSNLFILWRERQVQKA